MSRDAEGRWDDRYRTGDWVDLDAPAAIVRDAVPHLRPPGLALDLACGAGRNALFLAERGFEVIAVDISRQGLERLRAAAAARGLGSSVRAVHADLDRFRVSPGRFDLVVNTHFLLRSTFPLIRSALRPGGLLLFETYHIDEIERLGGDIRREYALERGELRAAFDDFEILLYEEGIFEREEGERGLARMIAKKALG